MNDTHGLKSGGATLDTDGGEDVLAAAVPGSFIVNLCALSAPQAIPQPRAPELKRFRFFVSRRLTNGRECFFLHMGFFATLAESEKWLSIVRGAYPGASVSKLAATPRVFSQEPALTDTQILRVLEARGPTLGADRGETHEKSGSYAVQSQGRLAGSLPTAQSTYFPLPQAKPIDRKAPAARVSGPRSATNLEDALQTLATSEFEMHSSDSSSTTGVRHLRMEIQKKKSKQAPKPWSARRS